MPESPQPMTDPVHDEPATEPQPPADASWLATTIARLALRVSRYPLRQQVGTAWRRQSIRRGGYPFHVHTADGLRLEAWFSPADPHTTTPTANTSAHKLPIVMSHGWIEVKEFHLTRARRLNALGRDVILFDHRAHGRSQGRVATFGVQERQDLRATIDAAQQRGLIADRLITMGFSMGGATVIEHAPEDDRVAGVISLAPFVNFSEAVRSFRFKLAPWINDDWLLTGFDAAVREAGFTFEEAAPIEAIRRLTRPLLLIEGGLDRNLPPRWHTHKLAQAAADVGNPNVQVEHIEHATHVSLCRRCWPGLDDKVEQFCQKIDPA